MPLKVLTDRCWLAVSDTLVGVVDPRLLLDLSMSGLTTVPDWSENKYGRFAVPHQRSSRTP